MQEASKNLVEDDYDAKSHLNAVKEAFNEVLEKLKASGDGDNQ